MIRVALLAPIRTSLYSRLVTHLLANSDFAELTDVVVRTPWTLRRIRGEVRRDGPRLLRKAYQKMVLGDDAYDPNDKETLRALAGEVGLPGKSLDDLARERNIRLTKVSDHNDEVALAVLREARPAAIVFTGGGLLRRDLLEIPALGVLNCHMGLLPAYRGMDVVEWPIVEAAGGPPQLGLTVHFMDQGIDTGPILLRRPIELRPGDTIASLRRRMEPQMVHAMLEAISGLSAGRLTSQPQRRDEGRQYYVMHARMMELARTRLKQLPGG